MLIQIKIVGFIMLTKQLSILLLLFSASSIQASTLNSSQTGGLIPGFYSESGSASHREHLAESSGEYIDPFSGALNLNHVDLVLPGNGGIDIVISRAYSSNNVHMPDLRAGSNLPDVPYLLADQTQLGLGWQMHFGRVRRENADLCANVTANSSSTSNPVLETAGGGKKQLFLNDGIPSSQRPSGGYITKDYWVAHCLGGGTSLLVVDPNGTKYHMSYRVATQSPQFGHVSYAWYTTKITDTNDNTLSIAYSPASSGERIMPSLITSSDGRRVELNYHDNGLLANIRYNGKTITYNYSGISLSSVVDAEGRKKSYGYYGAFDDSIKNAPTRLLKSYLTETGASTTYGYTSRCTSIVQCGDIRWNNVLAAARKTWSIGSKREYDRYNSINATWNFSYSHGSGYDYTTIAFSGGKYVYKHYSAIASASGGLPNYIRAGLLLSKTIYGAGNDVLQKLEYNYDNIYLSSQSTTRFPMSFFGLEEPNVYTSRISSVINTLDGTVYNTSYSNFLYKRFPQTITETGQANKVTRVTYKDISPIVSNVQQSRIALVSEDQSIEEQVSATNVKLRTIDRSIDSKGNLLSENKYGVLTRYTYHTTGDLHTVTDARGNVSEYKDYHRGVAKTELHPEGVTISRVVNDDGWVTSETNGRLKKTSYGHDKVGRIVSIVPPQGLPTSIVWTKDAFRLHDIRTISRGTYTQKTSYDGFGRVICDETEGIFVHSKYDSLGRVVKKSYPSSASSRLCHGKTLVTNDSKSYTYDVLGRPLGTKHGDNAFSSVEYNSGNKVEFTNENGHAFTYGYRSYGDPFAKELMSIKGPTTTGLNITIERNILGQTTSVRRHSNALGATRTYSYVDGSGNDSIFVMEETHPETGTTTYTRDAVGNISTKKVGNSPTATYTYDDLNRLSIADFDQKSDLTGTTASTTPHDVVYGYDANGNVTSIASGITSLSYTYDNNDNLVEEQQLIGGKSYMVSYGYDGLDHLSSITYPDDSIVSYLPDDLGRPSQATPYVSNVEYFDNSAIKTIAYANGRASSFESNDRMWVTRATTDGNVFDYQYTDFDKMGNSKRIIDGFTPFYSKTYVFDNLNRIVQAHGSSWGQGSVTYNLGTDDILRKNMGSRTLEYNYGGSNSRTLAWTQSNAQSFSNRLIYKYDDHGNIIEKKSAVEGWIYNYDERSNLRQVFDYAGNLMREYEYSGNNMKVQSTSFNPAKSRRFIYSHNGNLLLDEKQNKTGLKPTIKNVYLGSTLIAEAEVLTANPNDNVDISNPSTVYGYGYGESNHKDAIKASFNLTSVEPIAWCFTPFGVDKQNEVLLRVNGKSIGYISSAVDGQPVCFTIEAADLNVGANAILLTQSTSRETWGVAFHGFHNIVVPMLASVDAGTIFGNGYGDANPRHEVRAYFDLAKVEPYVVCMDGYDIDTTTEVTVSINGTPKGNMNYSGNNGINKTCFTFNNNELVQGRNYVEFKQNTPAEKWGVKFLSMIKFTTLMIPINRYLLRP